MPEVNEMPVRDPKGTYSPTHKFSASDTVRFSVRIRLTISAYDRNNILTRP
jgi:hypothetical protein